eukprot:1107409-Pleurochrysis_carterae.AAC.1
MTGGACTKSSFFISSWTSWSRMPPAGQPEPADFDADDVETNVQTAEPNQIQQMIEVWDDEKPFAKHRTFNWAMHAIQKAPPSFKAVKLNKAKAAKAAAK